MATFIVANNYLDEICEAIGIPANRTTRIIIDAKAGEPVRLYASLIGTEELVKLSPPEVLEPGLTSGGRDAPPKEGRGDLG